MHKEYHRLYSPLLGREMELSIYGHGGAPILVFPSSLAPHYEWEDRKLVDELGEKLENGWNQMFCVQTLDAENLYAKGAYGRAWKHPRERVMLYQAYQQHLVQEMVPYILNRNENHFLIVTGASFGAYHAVNFAFRNPGLARRVVGMSGLYDIRDWFDGYYDEDVYFNNPLDYMRNLSDEGMLWRFRNQLEIIFVAGSTSGEIDNNREMSQILWDKGIPNALHVWDGFAHDWPYWKQMIGVYVNG